MSLSSAKVIYGYSRAQALEDGFLIDVSDLARRVGIQYPCAVTSAVWQDYVAWTEEDRSQSGVYHGERNRLFDILIRFRDAAKRSEETEVTFSVPVVLRNGNSDKAQLIALKGAIGPGDDGSPVYTILKPDED